jgi:hypothetical protein
MIVGIYATLGVFLLMASGDPMKHLSLIWFTMWSSVVHGVIMAVQSFGVEMDGARHFSHLFGDVPALFIVAAALAFFTPVCCSVNGRACKRQRPGSHSSLSDGMRPLSAVHARRCAEIRTSLASSTAVVRIAE